MEREFERKCQHLIRRTRNYNEDWDNLENLSKEFLSKTNTDDYKSFKGFFYYGIALYKQGDFENSVKAFKEAERV
jgi:hypothetical protein